VHVCVAAAPRAVSVCRVLRWAPLSMGSGTHGDQTHACDTLRDTHTHTHTHNKHTHRCAAAAAVARWPLRQPGLNRRAAGSSSSQGGVAAPGGRHAWRQPGAPPARVGWRVHTRTVC
jgi:hypothetical protein